MSFRLKLICLRFAGMAGLRGPCRARGPKRRPRPSPPSSMGTSSPMTMSNNRARFFALATGQPATPDVLDRLKPQILQQLINERLEIQEIRRREIVVTDKQVAAADRRDRAEQQHGRRARCGRSCRSLGVEPGTLVSQVRTQLGWNQVLRQVVSEMGRPTRRRYRPPAHSDEEARCAAAIQRRRNLHPHQQPGRKRRGRAVRRNGDHRTAGGAPFPIIAAQFSQGETALQGGALGWVGRRSARPGGGAAGDPDADRRDQQSRCRSRAASSSCSCAAGRQAGESDTGADDVVLHVRQVFLAVQLAAEPPEPDTAAAGHMVKLHAIRRPPIVAAISRRRTRRRAMSNPPIPARSISPR